MLHTLEVSKSMRFASMPSDSDILLQNNMLLTLPGLDIYEKD